MEKVTKPKLFLETTIFNFYNYGKAQEKQRYTRKLFEAIAAGEYQAYTSLDVIDELRKDTKEKAENRISLIDKYQIAVLARNTDIPRLAQFYIDGDIIPRLYPDDARHIATATVYGLHGVVSYNFGHMVKPKTMIGTGFINFREGYLPVVITTPKEIVEYDPNRTHSRK